MRAFPEGAAEKRAKIVGIRTRPFSLAVDVAFCNVLEFLKLKNARFGLTMVSGCCIRILSYTAAF